MVFFVPPQITQIFTHFMRLGFEKEVNNQNSTNRFEDISENVDFGPKRGKFGPKRAQTGQYQIFPGTFTRLFQK